MHGAQVKLQKKNHVRHRSAVTNDSVYQISITPWTHNNNHPLPPSLSPNPARSPSTPFSLVILAPVSGKRTRPEDGLNVVARTDLINVCAANPPSRAQRNSSAASKLQGQHAERVEGMVVCASLQSGKKKPKETNMLRRNEDTKVQMCQIRTLS